MGNIIYILKSLKTMDKKALKKLIQYIAKLKCQN